MTQTELARRMGTHQSVIARWESGGTRPDFDTVRRAAKAAGFDMAVVLTPVGDDHDLSLIRRELSLSPHERLTRLVDAVKALDSMAAAARG